MWWYLFGVGGGAAWWYDIAHWRVLIGWILP